MEANTWIKQIQYDREKDKPSTLVTTDGWSYTEDSEAGKRAILEQNHRVTLTTNGVHSVDPDNGFEGMKKATVTVDIPPARLDAKRVTITKNNTSTLVEPELGYDGLSSVDCEVSIPTESLNFHFLREDYRDTHQEGYYEAETSIEPMIDSLLSRVKVTSTLMDAQETITQNGSTTRIEVPDTEPTSVIGFHTVEVTVEIPTTLYAWFPLDGTVSRPAYTTSLPDIGYTNVSFLIAGTTGSAMARYDTATVNASGNLEFTIDGTAYEYTRTAQGTAYDITVPYNR